MFIIYGRPFHLRSTHDNVRKYVGIPNFLTIANTTYKRYFQCADVPLTELVNENAVSLTTSLSVVLLKQIFTVPAVNVPGLIVCYAKIIDERRSCYSYIDLAKNI